MKLVFGELWASIEVEDENPRSFAGFGGETLSILASWTVDHSDLPRELHWVRDSITCIAILLEKTCLQVSSFVEKRTATFGPERHVEKDCGRAPYTQEHSTSAIFQEGTHRLNIQYEKCGQNVVKNGLRKRGQEKGEISYISGAQGQHSFPIPGRRYWRVKATFISVGTGIRLEVSYRKAPSHNSVLF